MSSNLRDLKGIYVLKQDTRACYETLTMFLEYFGFIIATVDPTLFQRSSQKHLMLMKIYVDDIILRLTDESMVVEFSKLMVSKYQMDMNHEINFFFGLQVRQLAQGIFLHQEKYTFELL